LKSFQEVEGNSAFVILHFESKKIWAIKRSAPLVCGINPETRDLYVSSDPYALVGFASKIFFPENEVLCECDPSVIENEINFFELDGSESHRYKLQKKELNLAVSEKGIYEHYMLKEIHEQPTLINGLLSYYTSQQGKEELDKIDKSFKRIHIAACGTALHAGYLIKNFIEKNNKIPVQIDFASEFRYRDPLLNKDELGLFISQSGETADTLACQELCANSGLKTMSIVNVEGSTLFRDCNYNLLIKAGVEIGVASTKAFTQQVLVGLLFSEYMKGDIQNLNEELKVLSNRVNDILDKKDKIKEVAQSIYSKQGFIFTGRGDHYPIALEGALKLKEIAYVHAEGYAAGELKHGPISLIDENMVNIALITPDLFEKTLSNAQEVKARKGIMVVVGTKDNKQLQDIADHYLELDYDGLKHTKPILTNVVLQLLSYYIAKLKGTDIDKPRNLAKSVTVE
jgi:glucosamine--fructose-6-phosphate aminotransferase (isomerizing)